MTTSRALAVFVKGCTGGLSQKGVAYRALLFSAVVFLGCLVGIVFGIDHVIEWALGERSNDSLWSGLSRILAWISLLAVGLALTPMIARSVLALTAPAIMGSLFDRIVEQQAQKYRQTGVTFVRQEPLPLSRSIQIDIYRMFVALVGSACIATLGFIGLAPIWGAAQLSFSIWCLGVDTLGRDHERRGRLRPEQDQHNKQHRLLVFGVGAIAFILYAIPIAQIAAPVMVTAGAAELSVWREAQESSP